jgi:6-pyruvoyltetrahydropterin/6-carboxytetrahydropterin synthase
MAESYRVEVQKEQMVFSAAHFITFGDDICESLHGHNYGVRVAVDGPLNHQAYVVDFIALRDQMLRLTGELDHKVLLPQSHPMIRVTTEGGEAVAQFRDRRWVFPIDNCVVLPVANTTAELLASHFGSHLIAWLERDLKVQVSRVEVGVDENHGQWGIWQWTAS